MPNGYGQARVITKVSKVPFSPFWNLGHESVIYVDNYYLLGYIYDLCLNNISSTIKILRELGFAIHTEKPMRTPTQTIVFLGLFISCFGGFDMAITLTKKKR